MPCFFRAFWVFTMSWEKVPRPSSQALPPSVGGPRENLLDHVPVLPLQVAVLLLDEGLRLT
jgi:hypothetical protein